MMPSAFFANLEEFQQCFRTLSLKNAILIATCKLQMRGSPSERVLFPFSPERGAIDLEDLRGFFEAAGSADDV